ncbi:MAG: DUF1330 domain-containing protein [Burkholderiaceae bacterium]|nr:DUF1330 domain-containing protein [Burkholderiaceae bacterium]MCD8516174.1 DUF1330 domain-containing protein [Burkholderiaceae bacterium]MCD8536705.1 DUF1330 domain-containing protein [Burkholderiaceae bacterium]MCD8566182.1 DUF1330 domain-containing protein [Burkholderiaceae bacterium]
MSAYVIAMVNVTDNDKYKKYMVKASEACAKYGGKYLVRGGETETMEGGFPWSRVVVLEFESRDRAREFYNSVEYQAGKKERAGAADFNMLIVDGA